MLPRWREIAPTFVAALVIAATTVAENAIVVIFVPVSVGAGVCLTGGFHCGDGRFGINIGEFIPRAPMVLLPV